METLKTFRHELKYIISYEDMLNLKKDLSELLKVDRSNDGYMIRSLYFDSINDDDYYDKLAGEMNRKKIRLRIYEPDPEFVKLELKAKYDTHQLKRSLLISREEAEELIKGNYEVLLIHNEDFANEVYSILKTGVYKPKSIIEYNRLAYITNTTTRITFDFNIKNSRDYSKFFDKDINYTNVTNKKDVVLEVKFDRYLEPYISSILAKYASRMQSVSKYVMARNLEGGNIL